MMTSAWLLLLALLTNNSMGSRPFLPHQEQVKESVNSGRNGNDDLKQYNYNDTYIKSTTLLFNDESNVKRLSLITTDKSKIYWSQPHVHKNRIPIRQRRSINIEDSVRSTEDIQLSKIPNRFRRATSKFTGLVVGASRDFKLLQTVIKTLSDVEKFIWSHQSQYSKPFSASKREPSVMLGTFSSDFRTNFHGYKSEASLRRSAEYSGSDINSLTTLLILQCLVEAALYGSATNPAASNVSISVDSLKNFYTRTFSPGSSIVTMWPEKLLVDQKVWVSRPENIIGGQVKGNTTFQQLQLIVKSCNCEPAKSGLQKISENRLCKDHFSTPLSEIFSDTANPPDFMTSFSNLALGSILQFTFPGKKSGIYKAESQLWLSGNFDVQVLINKLKAMTIVFPAKVPVASGNESVNISSNSTSSTGQTAAHITKREAINPNTTTLGNSSGNSNADIHTNTTLDNSTAISEVGNSSSELIGVGHRDDGNITQTNITERAIQSPADLIADESSDSNVTAESTDSADQVSTNTTAGEQTSQKEVTPMNDTAEHLQSSNTTTTPPASDYTTEITSPQPSITNTPTPLSVASNTTAWPAETTTTEKIVTLKVPEEVRVNQILSSESYYALRNYLDAVVPDAKEDVILIPSLLTDDENIDGKEAVVAKNDGNVWHNGKLFHSYNKVDLLTTATVLHGIITSSMSGIVKLQDDVVLQNIVVSSLRLLTWFLGNPQEVVTMVTLSAFPSRYQLYWVTARIAFQLNSRQAQSSHMFKFADGAILSFVKVLRDKMTFSILQSIIDGGLGQDGKTRVYIDDFIGVADLDDKGHKQVSGDDRVFTSAMAINILIATWTVQKDTGVLEFVKEIGDPVRIALNSLTNYVAGAVIDPANANLNAFMSEQTKNCETLTARYPANIITSSDGTELNPSQPELNQRFGVKGYISKVDYQNLLTKPTFGFTTRGGSLEDLNSPTSIFRFWSSLAYTKAVALLAIAQAANLEVDSTS